MQARLVFALLTVPLGTAVSPCLCIFDFDRTLTGKQNDTHHCPNNKPYKSIKDPAYGGGLFTLSQGALNMKTTFCKECYVGVISKGHAGGEESEMRDKVVMYLNDYKEGHLRVDNTWCVPKGQDVVTVTSSLVTDVPDGHKHRVANGIRDWFLNGPKGIHIAAENTHFFDDVAANVKQFEGHGYNARQISCKSRDNHHDPKDEIGYCGLTTDEVVSDSGIHYCDHAEATAAGSDVVV